jgi:hypothetical protein
LNQLSDAQALTVTGNSDEVVDLGVPFDNHAYPASVGQGIAVQVLENATTGGGNAYTFEAVQSALPDLSAPDVLATMTVPATSLTADPMGRGLLFLAFPPGTPTKRFIGMRYVLEGANPSVIVDAWVTQQEMVAEYVNYPKSPAAV